MSMTDPIADLLTRIRNAGMAGLDKLECPSSRMKIRILAILRDEGYLRSFKVVVKGRHDYLRISLKYLPDRQPVILGLKRISRPGLRQYVKHDKIPRIRNGMGTTILSTSQGLLTDREARKRGIGGEVICAVW